MTKTISLADDAYEAMRRAKRPGESFSELARRVFQAENRGSLAGLAGSLAADDDDWSATKKDIAAERQRSVRAPLEF